MANRRGRPTGRLIHAEAFEAILASRRLLKKDIAEDTGLSNGFISDLLAHRCGASTAKAELISRSLGVPVAALFPEAVGWVAPLPDRDGKRVAA